MNFTAILLRGEERAVRPQLPVVFNWLVDKLQQPQMNTMLMGFGDRPTSVDLYVNKSGALKAKKLFSVLEGIYGDELTGKLIKFAMHQGMIQQAPEEIQTIASMFESDVTTENDEESKRKDAIDERDRRGREIRNKVANEGSKYFLKCK
jgi:hypothetical protein